MAVLLARSVSFRASRMGGCLNPSRVFPLWFERIPKLLGELDKLRQGAGSRVPGARQVYTVLAGDPARTGTHDDDTIRQEHSFFDAVGHEQNRAPHLGDDTGKLFLQEHTRLRIEGAER